MTGLPPERPRPVDRFFGWLLIAVGALLALLCGACTLTLWGVAIYGMLQTPGADALGAAANLFFLVAFIGGVPTVGGVLLIWAGWRVGHPKRPAPKATPDTFG
ncbi:MAG TPA: hypothetical protein VGG29_18820 [Caulobacteraceae bacterium]|jgi:hypothetical protein